MRRARAATTGKATRRVAAAVGIRIRNWESDNATFGGDSCSVLFACRAAHPFDPRRAGGIGLPMVQFLHIKRQRDEWPRGAVAVFLSKKLHPVHHDTVELLGAVGHHDGLGHHVWVKLTRPVMA